MNPFHKYGYCLLFIFLFKGLTGCALSSPFIKYDPLVRNEIQSFKINANYRYYYSGPDARPNALLGIDVSHGLDSKFWKPIDLTEKQLKAWVHWRGPVSPSIRNHKGAIIYNEDGGVLGIWYGFLYGSHLPSVHFVGDKKVRISTPTSPVSGKWVRFNWFGQE